jgi:hypothetical protein
MTVLKRMMSQKMKKAKKKILILSANPKTTPQLRLDEEVREIEEGLHRSKYRDQFEIQSKWAVRLRDLRRALLDHDPDIVHFTGHGKEEGLIVEDELGLAASISINALSELFALFSEKVKCVILSACLSESQAKAISKHIDYVVGMRKEIDDKAAIEFAVGFYDALGAGRSVEDAFKFGCNAIRQTFPGTSEHLIPVLKKKIDKNKPIQVVIRSFKHYSEEPDDQVDKDKTLCLLDRFKNRQLVKGTWEDVKQEIKTFLTQTIKAGYRYDFFIPLHSSLAFFVGRFLDPKCGAEINIYQSSPRRELWKLSKKFEHKNEKIWTLEEYRVRDNGRELAAAVSVTHNVQEDVEAYVKHQNPDISHIIHLKLDKIHPGAIKDVSYAYEASYTALAKLKEKYFQMGSSRLHLFLSAPNVFTFILGQQSSLLSNITLYEYDFDAGTSGAYTPSITI